MKTYFILLLALLSFNAQAELVLLDTRPAKGKAYIDKFLDTSNGVICYLLRPEKLEQKEEVEKDGKIVTFYDGNNVGSISCVTLQTSKE